MARPRFSIVIPTREGGATLPYTLRTCLAQSFDDFEIVVGDNASGPAVKEAVDALADRRIHYFRSDTALAMTDSWEFAVSKAAGEYVMILGDDDGLLLHALPELDRILRQTHALALRWECGMYFWPGFPAFDVWRANDLTLPLNQTIGGHAIHHYRADQLILDAANSRISYTDLPLIYCGAIHHSLISQARVRAGRVFHSRYPDVYSSFAFAHLAGTYYSAEVPLCLRGISKKSSGFAYFVDRQSAVAREFQTLNAQADYTRHRDIPDLPVLSAVVADGFEQARGKLFPGVPSNAVDRRLLIDRCIQQLRVEDEDAWQRACQIVRNSLSDAPDLLAWFEATHGWQSVASVLEKRLPTPERSTPDGWLYLDAAAFGVGNVYDAARVCAKLLNYLPSGCRSRLSVGIRESLVGPGWPGLWRQHVLDQASARSPNEASEPPRIPVWRRAIRALIRPAWRRLRALLGS